MKTPLIKDFSIPQKYFDLSMALNDALRSYTDSWEYVTIKLYTPEELECLKRCSEILKNRMYGKRDNA